MKSTIKKLAAAAALAAAACAQAVESVGLDGFWDFKLEAGKTMEETSMPRFEPDSRMIVPGCWAAMSRWYDKQGTGCYRRSFELAKGVKNAFVVVDGFCLRLKCWIDGRETGFSELPWSRVEFETGPLSAGRHEIVFAVDSTSRKSKMFYDFYDFFAYGGLHHGVALETQSAPFEVRDLAVRTRDYKTGLVEIEAIFAGKGAPENFEAAVSFDGRKSVPLKFQNRRAKAKVPGFKLWSHETPNLHNVEVSYGGVSARARFGIRQVWTEGGKIVLNGKSVYLKGVNRHESHCEFGVSTPDQIMLEDVMNLKDLGGNFIRGSHYPQCGRFLDMCDEAGVLVWEESLGWGNSRSQLGDGAFCRLQEEQTRLMVRNSINHPCVIMSGFLNECHSNTEEGKALVERLSAAIRAEDSGHLVTFACSKTGDDIAHACTDVIAYNIYPCWYVWQMSEGTDAEMRSNIRKAHEACVKYFRGKFKDDRPIIVGETGVKADYGAHDPRGKSQYSEEFQADYERIMLEELFDMPEIAGVTIWQFTDCRTYTRRKGIPYRSYGVNTGGLYDLYRRPKLVVEEVRKMFKSKKD